MTETHFFTDKQAEQAHKATLPLVRDMMALMAWQLSPDGIDKLADKNTDFDGNITPTSPYIDALTELLVSANNQGLDIKWIIQSATLKFVGEGHFLTADGDKDQSLRFIYESTL
jgi:hypothetical protein